MLTPSKNTSESAREKIISNITVQPIFTQAGIARVEREWLNVIPSYLCEWEPTEVYKLKSFIRASVLAGIRVEAMTPTIQESHGLSKERAEFIARQESRIFSFKLKQIRYEESGVTHYTWKCVNGSPKYPVRPMHKLLDGKIFSWDDPPVVNENGDRMHPGEDVDCRCIARPIVKF